MHCWSCGYEMLDPPHGKLSFRAVCDKCGMSLHCCVNCKYYKPGLPNDCAVPGTEFIRDREANNLCDEYSLLGQPPKPKDNSSKKRFEDLFS